MSEDELGRGLTRDEGHLFRPRVFGDSGAVADEMAGEWLELASGDEDAVQGTGPKNHEWLAVLAQQLPSDSKNPAHVPFQQSAV